MRPHSRSLSAILLVLATQTATLAPFATAAAGGERCPMTCCAGGESTSCPMRAAPQGSSFRSCPSDPDKMTASGRIVLALPTRVLVFFDRHPSGAFLDVASPAEVSVRERPAIPPPERPASI